MPVQGWPDEQTLRLIGWMEEHISEIKGSTWYRKCKDEVFADDNTITAGRIRSKHNMMKTSWQNTKTMAAQSNFGRTEEECSQSINGTLPILLLRGLISLTMVAYIRDA